MPLRKLVLPDGREISKNITDIHPNGEEFLPEEYTIPFDKSGRGPRIYSMLAEVIRNIAENHAGEDKMNNKPKK